MNLIQRGTSNRSTRYRRPPGKRALDMSCEWSKHEPPARIECRRDQVASLFESALAQPLYDANKQAWDKTLAALNLRLCYQPAVVKVLSEGRWRNKENPRAYVATAAARQALGMRLPDFCDREFMRVSGGNPDFDSGEQATRRQSMSPPRYNSDGELMPDAIEDAADICGYSPSAWERIPDWLQRDEESDAVDWGKVAQYAARKPSMAQALTKALEFRAAGISRPRAVSMAKSNDEARELEAAWKWIDREWERRIVPLFHREKAPELPAMHDQARPARQAGRKSSFVAPGEALARIASRHKAMPDHVPAPSISKRDHLHELADGLGLRRDVRIGWNGSSLNLSLIGPDNRYRTYSIYGDTLDEALEVLRYIREDGEIPELFRTT